MASHVGNQHWLPCVECDKPRHYYWRCQEHFREYNRKNEDRKRQRRRQIQNGLPVHTRICIDCMKPFLSQRGFNLCLPCADKVMLLAGSRTLDKRGIRQINAAHYHAALLSYYGTKYRATHKPKIPLSALGVFDTL